MKLQTMSQDPERVRLPFFPVDVLSTVLSTEFLLRQEAQYWPHDSCGQSYSDINVTIIASSLSMFYCSPDAAATASYRTHAICILHGRSLNICLQ